jgi:co-chaperonin GroES (HSP10)
MEVLGNRVLVRIVLTNNKYGKLYLPEQKKTQEAVVVGVGSACSLPLKEGDRVIWDVFGGIALEEHSSLHTVSDGKGGGGGEKLIFLTEDEIIAKIEPDLPTPASEPGTEM